MQKVVPAPGHCIKGHQLAQHDYYPTGNWRCGECARVYGREYAARKREENRAAKIARYVSAWQDVAKGR